jgi:hypothetical protein
MRFTLRPGRFNISLGVISTPAAALPEKDPARLTPHPPMPNLVTALALAVGIMLSNLKGIVVGRSLR